jgi:hypothetical protein
MGVRRETAAWCERARRGAGEWRFAAATIRYFMLVCIWQTSGAQARIESGQGNSKLVGRLGVVVRKRRAREEENPVAEHLFLESRIPASPLLLPRAYVRQWRSIERRVF